MKLMYLIKVEYIPTETNTVASSPIVTYLGMQGSGGEGCKQYIASRYGFNTYLDAEKIMKIKQLGTDTSDNNWTKQYSIVTVEV